MQNHLKVFLYVFLGTLILVPILSCGGGDSGDSGVTSTSPDLTITSFTSPSSGTQDQDFNVSATVKNNGSISASSFRIGIYRSSNNIISTSDTLLGYCDVSSLGGGSSTTCAKAVSISTTGDQYVGAIADYQSYVSESNESNNTDYNPIYLTPSDDDGDTFSTATTISIGTSYNRDISTSSDLDYFKFTTSSAGTITVSLTGLTADLDVELYNSSQSFLDSSPNGGTTSEEIIYPASSSGTFYVKVLGGSGATSSYTLKVTFTSDSGPVIISLSISGVSQINENSFDSYTASAFYSDGSSQTVVPAWSENSNFASVNSSGVVTTFDVPSNQSFTLTASYSGLTATKNITIIDANSGGNPTFTQITTLSREESHVAWSPDGTKLVFEAYDSINGESRNEWIWTVDATGGNPSKISISNAGLDEFCREPFWGPSGYIVFEAAWGSSTVYKVPAQGGSATRLAGPGDDNGNIWIAGAPAWDWSGSNRIAFVAEDFNGAENLYLIYDNGTGLTKLTNYTSANRIYDVSFSPNGAKLAYSHDNDIWILDIASGATTQLTSNTGNNAMTSWSPDGTMIAFTSIRNGNFDIYTMTVSSGTEKRITTDIALDSDPAWSPDGTKIAFTSDRNGTFDIWVVSGF